MGLWEHFKNKNKEKETNGNEEPKLLYGFYVNGKYINVLGARIIRSANGMDTYVCNICETDREEDTMFFDAKKPISFELPQGRSDLIKSVISLWYQNKSNRELGDIACTFIGDIKPGPDGQLYYYNEPASRETMEALRVEDQKLIEERKQEIERKRQLEAKRQEDKFRESLRIKEEEARQQQWIMKEQQQRIQNSYFKSINNSENYDLTNVETGTILTIRNIKKYKDENGRYLYKAKINEVRDENYTDFFEPVGYDVTFTVPGRLYNIVNDSSNPTNEIIRKNLQKLLSHSYGVLENNNVDSVIDLGGILPDGRIIKNNKGISQPLYSKILELGGSTSIDDLEREGQER